MNDTGPAAPTPLQPPAHVLRLIRLGLVGGVAMFGVVAAYLSGAEGVDVPGPMMAAFLGVSLAALAGLFVLRRMRPGHPAAGQLTVAGWALGEASALFGGVLLSLTTPSRGVVAVVMVIS